uniref:Uncharacterized protein n=1 Tax=Arundo donax TaxID=35708 RepID=A0A0A9B6S3_ARUDO
MRRRRPATPDRRHAVRANATSGAAGSLH